MLSRKIVHHPSGILELDTGWKGGGYIQVFLVPHGEGYVLIETGPESSRGSLEKLLGEHDLLRRITHIVVTHIHLDHAGAAASLQKSTGAPIFVHPRGVRHLKDPEKLLASARALFGAELEERWGIPEKAREVHAVADGERLVLSGEILRFYHTPGHAEHHMAIYSEATKILFPGDVAGVRLGTVESVLPPTAPPEFHYDAWMNSIELLQGIPCQGLAITHGGLYLEDVQEHWKILKGRLKETITTFLAEPDVEVAKRRTMELWEQWLHNDPQLISRTSTIMPFPGCMWGIEGGLKRYPPQRNEGKG